MATGDRVEKAISSWFEETAPARLPRRVLDATFERTRRSRQRAGWPVLLGKPQGSRSMLALGAAAVVVAAVALALGVYVNQPSVGGPPTPAPTESPSPTLIPGSMPAEQATVVAREVAALNGRDVEAFAEVFADDGAFNPRGTFMMSTSLFSNTLPIADRHLVEPFMAINEAWRFEAEIVACNEVNRSEYVREYTLHDGSSDLFGLCAITSRWPALSLEVSEWWVFEFKGADILWWGQRLRDATPADRTLPLALDGLLEWEAWLEANDPDAAARLLNPREFPVTVPCDPCEWSSDDVDVERVTTDHNGRAERDWVIARQRFSPSALIPYDPALADEIEASIHDYLEERGP